MGPYTWDKGKGMRKAKLKRPARTWVPLPDPAPGVTEPLYVSFPTAPDEEALAEASSYVATLEARRQIAREPGIASPGATHRIEVDAQGRRRLVRVGFSAG
jgi:hypothetical protein